MNCKEAEANIYRLSDLSEADKIHIMEHCQTCETCSETLESVQNYEGFMKLASATPIEIINGDQFTNRIMSAINKQQNKNSEYPPFIKLLFGYNLLRVTLSTMSLALIIGFSIEFFKEEGQINIQPDVETTQKITKLSSGSFLEKFKPMVREDMTIWEALKASKILADSTRTNFRNKIENYEKDE